MHKKKKWIKKGVSLAWFTRAFVFESYYFSVCKLYKHVVQTFDSKKLKILRERNKGNKKRHAYLWIHSVCACRVECNLTDMNAKEKCKVAGFWQ